MNASQPTAGTHASRRLSAANAASASNLVPINSKRSRSLTTDTPSSSANGSSGTSGKPKKEGVKTVAVPRRPPAPVKVDDLGRAEILQGREVIDSDELYGEQERMLGDFLKLHPMLSLESTSHRTLQLVADLVNQSTIPTTELEVVPKSHDDRFLRGPELSIGERPCCLNERCICVWLARWRYGDDTDMAFVGTEFLLPSQEREFTQSGKLPTPPGKCLLCSRYYTNYLYKLARSDPTFRATNAVPLQAFGNVVGSDRGDSVPSHSSVVSGPDGYKSECLLYVDEAWADTAASRGPMGTLLWRPVVAFSSKHYKYERDPVTSLPRLTQVGVGFNEVTIKKIEQQQQHMEAAMNTKPNANDESSSSSNDPSPLHFRPPVSHPTVAAGLAK